MYRKEDKSLVWCRLPGIIIERNSDVIVVEYAAHERRKIVEFAACEVAEFEYEIGGDSKQVKVGERVNSVLCKRSARDRHRLAPYAE